jgi:YfiH family protein
MSIDGPPDVAALPRAAAGGWRHAGNLVWWEGSVAGATVRFSTRRIGSSSPPYDSLNLGLHVGDDPERVLANRRGFRAAALAGLELPIVAEQVHGTRVAVVGAEDAGRGWERREEALPETDALVTREAEVPLSILVADCAPVALVVPEGVIGAAHAGWRGLAGAEGPLPGVLEATIAIMESLGGSPAATITALVGPCIRGCCYEVGPEVWRHFPESCLAPASVPDARRLDLLAAVRDRLERCGVPAASVHAPGLCTACHPDLFFSHRRATGEGHPATGRMALFVATSPAPPAPQ